MIRCGNEVNYWIETDSGIDISRGAQKTQTCGTSKLRLTFNPQRSALVIIDMQNFFCSERLGRGKGARALVEPIKRSVLHAGAIGPCF